MINLLIHEAGLQSEELEKCRKRFNDRISTLQKKYAEHEGTIASLRTPHRHLLTSAKLARSHDLKIAAIEVMRDEYVLRHEIAETYLPLLQKVRQEATERAFQEHETIQQEIKEGLVKMGYIDGVYSEANILGITPEMIRRHPRALEASARHANAQSLSYASPDASANNDAIEFLGKQIDIAVEKLTRT